MTKLSFQRYLHLSLHLFLLGETSLSMLYVLLIFFLQSLVPRLYLYPSFRAGDNLKQRGHTGFLGPILCLPSDVLWAFKWYCSYSAPSHALTEIFSVHIYILSSGLLTHKTVIPTSNKNICPQEQDNLLSEQAQGLKGWAIPMLTLATGCQTCFSICREQFA